MPGPADRGASAHGSVATATALLALLLLAVSVPAVAQTPPTAPPPQPAQVPPVPEDSLGRSTPFGSVTGFIRAERNGDNARAAEYLQTNRRGAAAEELAQQLYIVLDRGLNADLDRLSRSPEGHQQDGLPSERDRVGIVTTPAGSLEVVVARVARADQPPIWLFAADTLAGVPAASEELAVFDPLSHLPSWLVDRTFLAQPLYRWIGVPLLLALALLLGTLLSRTLAPLLRPVLRRMTGEQDARATAALGSPIRLILIALAIRLFSGLGVSLATRQFWTRVSVAVAIIGGAWFLTRLGDIVAALGSRRLQQRRRPERIAVLALGRRLFKGLVVTAAVLSLLYRAGVDLTAILTGLGIGGLGLALAAQKTLENFLGGVMVISDEPLRVGDFCQVGDQLGTVEDIGLRSTRLRTLSRTVVSIPNGQLATMNVENFSQRDKFWLHHLIGLRYRTSADQLRHVLAGIRAMLQAHPKVEREGARVRFVGFRSSSLELEIFAYVIAGDHAEFLAIQEDILFRIMDLVAESGTSMAFPSQTTFLARDTPVDADRRQAAERAVQQWRDRGEIP